MKTKFALITSLFFYLQIMGQSAYHKGYFIDNSNNRIQCYILFDVKRNTTSFQYKISEEDDKKQATITNVKEFGIDGKSKFIRETVNIDRSNYKNGRFSTNKNPVWSEEELFLEVIIDGEADLFYYTDDRIKRFFYRVSNDSITQLIYFKYYVDASHIGENNHYKQSLINKLECEAISHTEIKNLEYKLSSLKNLFIKYNKCKGTNPIRYEAIKKRQAFKFKFKAGINLGSMSAKNVLDSGIDVDFSDNLNFHNYGLEFEYILPFKNPNWSARLDILLGDTYNVKEVINTSLDQPGTDQDITASHISFEMPLSLRRYFTINNDTKIFVNVSYGIVFGGSSMKYEIDGPLKKEKESTNFRFGAGVSYKRWDFELLYKGNKTGTYEFTNTETKYRSFVFSVAYQIF